jgi:hypothetical protein
MLDLQETHDENCEKKKEYNFIFMIKIKIMTFSKIYHK